MKLKLDFPIETYNIIHCCKSKIQKVTIVFSIIHIKSLEQVPFIPPMFLPNVSQCFLQRQLMKLMKRKSFRIGTSLR